MAEVISNFNTSMEAHKLVKDPTKLFALLYSKYGDIIEDYQTSLMNQIIYKCSTHLNIQYQEIRYDNIFLEFLRRFYRKKEVKERIPNLYEYYKNYHLFYLKPFLRNFYYVKLLHNYQDKKAEIFYKNNYSKSSNDKTHSEENSVTSSLSSSDHFTDYRVIFNTKIQNLLEGKKNNSTSISIELSKIKKNGKNNNTENDLRIRTKILEESTLNDIMKELKTDANIYKEIDNDNNKETNISSKYKKKSEKKVMNNKKNSRKKNNSPKIYSKSPTFQMNHQIHIIKPGTSTNSNNNNVNNNMNNINNNINSNLINQQMYILSQKNSYTNKRNNSNKNKHFSPKMSYYIHNIASKFEEMFKKYPVYFNSIKHRKNKTGNNSNNNTIKKSGNLNNNIYSTNNNFQSNFKKFSKLSASLKNNKFNITYFSQINSNNNSRSSMSAKKSNKLQKNKKIINELNQFNIKTKKGKHKKNKTFDFNVAKGHYIELKKNYTNYNLLRFKPSYSNANKTKNMNPMLFNLNMMKSPKNNFGLKNNKDSNEKSGKIAKNKRFTKDKNKIFKNNKKSFVSIASCSSPKFSFIMNKNEPLTKESSNTKNTNNTNINNNLNNNIANNNNNVDSNLYSFLNSNKNNMSKIKKNKYRKNNISYTNNNFNINFNNIFFGSSRPTSGAHGNIISDNINTNTNTNLQINKNININNNYSINNINNLSNSNSISLNTKKHTTLIHQNNILNCKSSNINNNYNNNINSLYIKSLNNLYNFSRNKNNKISNCSHTQTQSQSIAKNSKVIRISDSKIPVNKTNSFILRCENNNKNVSEDKNMNLNNNINQKKAGRAKIMNQIEDLIMKTKKHVKFGSEHKNKVGTIISNKPVFNNCNNKSKNQIKNKSSYHELFIKNLKRTSSTSIKVNTKSISSNSNNNNNQAVNVIYKK